MSILDVIKALRATTSKNDKIEILKQNDSAGLRDYLFATYDPQTNYYIKKIPEPVFLGRDPMPYFVHGPELLGHLSRREVTGHAAIEAVAKTLGRLDPEGRELLTMVLNRDVDAGINISTINKAFPGLIFEAPYMRCETEDNSKWDKWDWNQHHYCQLKADGMFVNVIKTSRGIDIMTRGGNVFPRGSLSALCWHIDDSLPLDYVTHGELVVYEEGVALPRTLSNGMLNSLLQGGEIDTKYSVRLLVWDAVPVDDWYGGLCSTRYVERLERLKRNLHTGSLVELIETRIIHSVEEAKEIALDWMKQGYEGAIVKNADGMWKDHTSPNQIKIKAELEVELRITGMVDGKGKNKNLFGSLSCQSECGGLTVDVSGFTDELRKEIFDNFETQWKNKVITVRANQLLSPSKSNKLYSLFLPRFVEKRNDRNEADSLERIISIFSPYQKEIRGE